MRFPSHLTWLLPRWSRLDHRFVLWPQSKAKILASLSIYLRTQYRKGCLGFLCCTLILTSFGTLQFKIHGYWNTIIITYLQFIDYCLQLINLYFQEGAQTSIYCAVSDKVVQETGRFYVSCKPTKSSPESMDEKLAKALWEKSANFVDLMPHETVVWNWNKDCNLLK